jgi:ABC-type bacteriocin/lantibiotic exporter with double-glycine peptidase domain
LPVCATLRDRLAIQPGEKIALIGKCGSGSPPCCRCFQAAPTADGVLTVDGHDE